jgi:hypothetical protein
MGGQQKDFISDIVFFQHQDGMHLKVRRHFLQCGKGKEEEKDFRKPSFGNCPQDIWLLCTYIKTHERVGGLVLYFMKRMI